MVRTKIVALWGYDEDTPMEWIKIPVELEPETLGYLEKYHEVAGFLEPRGEIYPTSIVNFLASKVDSLLWSMLPYGIGREKFGSLADAEDWEGWNAIAHREIYQKVMAGAPYHKMVPDPSAPVKSSYSMYLMTTGELTPPKEIFEYRWEEYQKKLSKHKVQYTEAKRLLSKLQAWEGEDGEGNS